MHKVSQEGKGHGQCNPPPPSTLPQNVLQRDRANHNHNSLIVLSYTTITQTTNSYDALLKEIDSAIDRACASHPQKPIFLMGHGMGGALALNYVCGLGLRITSLAGLISSSPYLKPTLAGAGSRFPGTYNRLGKWYSHLSIRFPVIPEELTRNREEQERHREDGMILDSVSLQCLGDMIYQGQKVLNKRWRHFPAQLPTLLLHGTADPICAFVATQQLSQQIIQKLKPASFVFKSWKGGMHDRKWHTNKHFFFLFGL